MLLPSISHAYESLVTFFKSLSGSASWSAAFRFSVDTSLALSFSVIRICKYHKKEHRINIKCHLHIMIKDYSANYKSFTSECAMTIVKKNLDFAI